MQRFFFQQFPLGKDIVISEESFVHQIGRVLRSEIGEEIILFCGDRYEYVYIITSITKKDVHLSFKDKHTSITDSGIYIRLYQAIPNKYEKIEYILQKGVEVGIHEFIFFRSERSQGLVINDRKKERFLEILKEATEQSYGNNVPSLIFNDTKYEDPENGLCCIFHTDRSKSQKLSDVTGKDTTYNIFVGPEGGWSEKEISAFQEKKFLKIHLGERILRTETTGVVTAFFLGQK